MIKQEQLVKLLIKKKLTIGSVESLTAGLFASTLASVPGASNTLKGALVTYQSSFKTSLLKISKAYVNKYKVVSEEVATMMAQKGKDILKTDIVISFTGNAGPSKEIGGAEVGRVYSAISYKNKIYNFTKIYKGSRNKIRSDVTDDGINNILKILSHKK